MSGDEFTLETSMISSIPEIQTMAKTQIISQNPSEIRFSLDGFTTI